MGYTDPLPQLLWKTFFTMLAVSCRGCTRYVIVIAVSAVVGRLLCSIQAVELTSSAARLRNRNSACNSLLSSSGADHNSWLAELVPVNLTRHPRVRIHPANSNQVWRWASRPHHNFPLVPPRDEHFPRDEGRTRSQSGPCSAPEQ